jgi:hypothetical protein
MANWNEKLKKYYLLVYFMANYIIKSSRENKTLTINGILPLISRTLHLNLNVIISKTLTK